MLLIVFVTRIVKIGKFMIMHKSVGRREKGATVKMKYVKIFPLLAPLHIP